MVYPSCHGVQPEYCGSWRGLYAPSTSSAWQVSDFPEHAVGQQASSWRWRCSLQVVRRLKSLVNSKSPIIRENKHHLHRLERM